ncbi:hypothetical protein FIBSPDRAFT_900567 [Athelia psychrophila]|uniref:Uncharacterized protein n=1 Tax=Athelia psychrophila TaxID=1759441 RepID=A0A165Y9D1_9AGAM|nr:hypothetical protein FIBSPDRAFT_900567 [Fibularhizoctonia sp. CBS 109695]
MPPKSPLLQQFPLIIDNNAVGGVTFFADNVLTNRAVDEIEKNFCRSGDFGGIVVGSKRANASTGYVQDSIELSHSGCHVMSQRNSECSEHFRHLASHGPEARVEGRHRRPGGMGSGWALGRLGQRAKASEESGYPDIRCSHTERNLSLGGTFELETGAPSTEKTVNTRIQAERSHLPILEVGGTLVAAMPKFDAWRDETVTPLRDGFCAYRPSRLLTPGPGSGEWQEAGEHEFCSGSWSEPVVASLQAKSDISALELGSTMAVEISKLELR